MHWAVSVVNPHLRPTYLTDLKTRTVTNRVGDVIGEALVHVGGTQLLTHRPSASSHQLLKVTDRTVAQ